MRTFVLANAFAAIALFSFMVPAFGAAEGSVYVPLPEGTEALLIKVQYETDEAKTQLFPADFTLKVKFDPGNVEFTLIRNDQARSAVAKLVEDPALSISCRDEVKNAASVIPGALRKIPGTAVILIHENGQDHRRLRMGTGLTLVSVEPLKVAL